MSLAVFSAVLGAALMHATWNALIKLRLDPFLAISLMTMSMGVGSLCLTLLVAMPEPHVWPFLLLSIAMQNGYRLFLSKAYEAGDLAQTYALARGTAPLLVTLGGVILLGEVPSPIAGAGIVLLCMGTLFMSLRGGVGRVERRAVGFALLTSTFIAGYTLADGSGSRLTADMVGYLAWMFVVDGVWTACLCLMLRGQAVLAISFREWVVAGCAGVLSALSYGTAVWAMRHAPVASVAALRETSILFAMGIAVFWLKERMTLWRGLAALLIVAGMAALRLG